MASSSGKVRFAVVGLGHIAQAAILPAFEGADNAELTALVSNDAEKRDVLARRYNVPRAYSYEDYDECLSSGKIDAVYIALPNHLHRDYMVRAAEKGIHVLCEKPMAVTTRECEAMIYAAAKHKIKHMIAYRLHFEAANLRAIELVQSGEIGEPRIFNSLFTIPVREHNIRVNPRTLGGGPVYDIGIYCINAARYLFGEEPVEVFAATVNGGKERFREIEEGASVIMRFPNEKLASFTCSFDGSPAATYQVAGTKGVIHLENAYEYAQDITLKLATSDHTQERVYTKRDQFAPQLVYFSDCILNDKEPEPSGREGMADIRIIEAIFESARTGQWVSLGQFIKLKRPNRSQDIKIAPHDEPDLVNVEPPNAEEAA